MARYAGGADPTSAREFEGVPNKNDFKRPSALGPGSRVALVAPAGPLAADRVELSVQRCENMGFEPIVYPSARQSSGYLAGSDDERLGDLQRAFDDSSLSAVWALRGGYGSTRILKRVDLNGMIAHPKAFIGFSDNTALHAILFEAGLVSFHGPHPGGAFPPETELLFRRVLSSTVAAGVLPKRPDDPRPVCLHGGRAEAPLFGGNLALLAALCGTRPRLSARGTILFIEDVGEPAYKVDRLLIQLRDSGVLEGVAGLALGRFSEVAVEEDTLVQRIFTELAQELRVPALFDLPIGHIDHNWTVPLGVRARIDADQGTLELMEPAVQEAT